MSKSATLERKAHKYRGQSRDERQAERRRRLVQAAIELYGRDGYHATAVRAVCAHAGLTERYFYESFENSEALITAAYAQLIARLRERLETAIRAAPRRLDDMSRAALGAFFATMQEDPAGARIILHEVLGISPAVDSLYRRAIRDFEQLVRQMVETFVGAGNAPRMHMDLVAAGMIGAVLLMAWRWMQTGYHVPVGELVDTAMMLFGPAAREYQALGGASP